MKKTTCLVLIAAFILGGITYSRSVEACGHEGFFFGGGYQQLFMYTPEDRLVGQQQLRSQQIKFGPGFGAHLLMGYDFEGSRWGVQAPLSYSYFKLNDSEWVHYFDVGAEAILHLAYWDNGFDISLVGGVGASILPEGPVDNNSGTIGINAGLGPSFSYFFAREGKIKGSIYIQVPVRMVHFFGNNLSRNGTTALQVPIRIGLSVGGF